MKLSFRILMALCAGLVTLGVCAWAQTAADYDALVERGNTQLQASNNNDALASANAAIKTNADRWEAYALAGGALINLKRCDEAKADLEEAIKRAPEAKHPALGDLSGKCVASASRGGDSTGPSYTDTVGFIQDKIRIASFPSPGYLSRHGNIKTVSDDAKYTFSVDGCQSMTITTTIDVHTDDCSADDHSCHHTDGQFVKSVTVPFKSVTTYSVRSELVPAVFSTHEPTTNQGFGPAIWVADGYAITQDSLNAMTSEITSSISPRGRLDQRDWHDAVWIVAKDTGPSWTVPDNSEDDPDNRSGNFSPSGLPILTLRFMMPGTGGESTHGAKAIQHLVELCVNHPDQGPKELF
jgi:hypothetical protein